MEDRYLSRNNAVNRLVDEYHKYGSIIVSYDYDGTVHDYHGVGDTYPRVYKLLRDLRDYARFIVYTCSPSDRYPIIREYLKANDLPFDKINENIVKLNDNPKAKLYYNILLDDRAGLGECVDILEEFLTIIKDNETCKNTDFEPIVIGNLYDIKRSGFELPESFNGWKHQSLFERLRCRNKVTINTNPKGEYILYDENDKEFLCKLIKL